jgi:hypothetical protein
MKKTLFILIPSLLLALALFLIFQTIVRANSQKGALQVTSSPESKVYLNDKYLGQTPLCKCEANEMITAGDYTIRMVPTDNTLQEFQEKITISEGVLTVVDRKFGKDSLSEGSIISLSPIIDKNKTQLVIATFPEGASVSLDNNPIGTAPLSQDNPTESDHMVTISKTGYKDKTIRVRTPKGYKLTVAVYLGISDALAGISPTPVPSTAPSIDLLAGSATPSKSPLDKSNSEVTKITILNTPTGFLRVRGDNSQDSAEIGRVNPGESYSLLDEKDGWFKIKLESGQTGWVSAQYAKKQ